MIGVAVLALGLSACGSIFPQRKLTEFRNADVSGAQFKTIAVIAGDDSSPGLRMSVLVREQLNKEGWSAVKRAGRWQSENEAVADICRGTEQRVDGVLIVHYNQLTLRACSVDTTAYRITSSGGEMGLPQLGQRLIAYLRTGS